MEEKDSGKRWNVVLSIVKYLQAREIILFLDFRFGQQKILMSVACILLSYLHWGPDHRTSHSFNDQSRVKDSVSSDVEKCFRSSHCETDRRIFMFLLRKYTCSAYDQNYQLSYSSY